MDRYMTHNSRLVQYFISEFYSSKTFALEHIASPTFTFIVDDGEKMDFRQYANRKDLMSGSCQLDFEPPETVDDENFSSKLKLVVPRKDQPNLYGTGVITFNVSKDLLQSVIVNYNQTGENNQTLQMAILESQGVNSEAGDDKDDDLEDLVFL